MKKMRGSKLKYLIFILVLIFLGSFYLVSAKALEQNYPTLPGIPPLTGETKLPGLINYIYTFAFWIAGLITFFMLVIGGFRWLTSVGSPTAIAAAKKQITSAIVGLVLLLSSFIILNTLNPELVMLRDPLEEVQPQLEGITTNAFGGVGKGITMTTYENVAKCETNGFEHPDWPTCGYYCNALCKTQGSYFGVAGGGVEANLDIIMCTCFNDAIFEGVRYAGEIGYTEDVCECFGDASPLCGDFCHDKCRENGHSFGVVSMCLPGSDLDWVSCSCFDTLDPSIKQQNKDLLFTNGEPNTITWRTMEICEAIGEATPPCGDYCNWSCKEERGYLFGYNPVAACYAGADTDVVDCTCIK